jgi:hypothetical protein
MNVLETVAVWGSCVSRDVFEVRETPLRVVSYQARTSWISQTAPPVPDARERYGASLEAWEDRMGLADIEKATLPSLIAAQPDILLIDLYEDAAIPTMQAGPYLASWNRWGHKKAAVEAAAGEPGSELALKGSALTEAFAGAVAMLGARLQAALPDTILVLHECRAARAWRGKAPAMPIDVLGMGPRFDARTAALEAAALARLPGMSLLIANPATRLADPAHRTGPMMVHYVPEYYDDVLSKLEQLAGLH